MLFRQHEFLDDPIGGFFGYSGVVPTLPVTPDKFTNQNYPNVSEK
jgi:hypothetical protein